MTLEQVQDVFRGSVIEEYAPFLKWLHERHCVNIRSVCLTPMPRIRGGTEYPYESCVRIIVRKKLAPSELHPNSGEEWAALYNLFLTEKYTGHAETFVNLRGTKQIMIPSTLAGWATDIVEKENTEQ